MQRVGGLQLKKKEESGMESLNNFIFFKNATRKDTSGFKGETERKYLTQCYAKKNK
jgi:hypothetical protein